MTLLHVGPTASETSVNAIDCVRNRGIPGVLSVLNESTNTEQVAPVAAGLVPLSPVERTMEYAVFRYEDVLRRLAE